MPAGGVTEGAVNTDVAVVGQIARSLVLEVDGVPDAGGTGVVRSRREALGGSGANQAAFLARLGVSAALFGVVGDDDVGADLLAQARWAGIDMSWVVRRPNTASGLIVELLDGAGRCRCLEDLAAPVRLTRSDVVARAEQLTRSRAVLVHLQQPPDAALAAAALGRRAGRRVVLDGAPPEEYRSALLACADVLRAGARETQILADDWISSVDDAVQAGRGLLREGPGFVVLALAGEGNVFVWREGHVFLPHIHAEKADTAVAGDAFTAALTAALSRGDGYLQAARWAVAAAALSDEPGD